MEASGEDAPAEASEEAAREAVSEARTDRQGRADFTVARAGAGVLAGAGVGDGVPVGGGASEAALSALF